MYLRPLIWLLLTILKERTSDKLIPNSAPQNPNLRPPNPV